MTEELKVSRQAEDKITYKLGLMGMSHCKEEFDAYNNCVRGRTVSVLWSCRNAYKASQDCLHLFVNQANQELVKRRWVDAGRPTHPDWSELMSGLQVDPENRGPPAAS